MGYFSFVPKMELHDGLRTTTWRYRSRVFGTQTELNAACAVASRLAGRTIIPGGPNQHVRDEHLTMFIVHTVSGLVEARLVSQTTWCTSSTPRTTSKTRA